MNASETLGQPGDRLGVWRLDEPFAKAPSGHWWRASHTKSGQAVLLLIYADTADAGAVLLRMAGTDGHLWTHPDIAWPLDSGMNANQQPYVVLPLLAGTPLTEGLAAASLRRRLEWVVQLCELLLLAQQQGLSLVELDPSLLWVGPQQQLRLHALALLNVNSSAMQMGSLQGQICRAAQPMQSPQAVPGAAGTPADQAYRVGKLAGWLVTGRWRPDADGSLTPSQTLLQWLSLRTEARDALNALLVRAVADDPAERPQDLVALAEAVEAWLDDAGGLGSGAAPLDALPAPTSASPTPAPASRALRAPVAQPKAEPSTAPTARAPSGPRGALPPAPGRPGLAPILIVAVAIVVVALAVAAYWWKLRGG